MSHDTSIPAATPSATPEKQALLDAFDTVIKTAEEERAREAAATSRPGPRASRLVLGGCAAILVFISAYLYVERPDWVFPTPPVTESTAVREASLRIGVANAVQHIEHYRQQTGRLPATLLQAGATGSAIHYEPTDSGYQVEGEENGVRVSYLSGESLTRFLGNSFAVMAGRPR